MVKVVKFGGSSLASAEQFKKVGNIIRADEDRKYVVPSAPGKRFPEDTKVTDMLYKCYAEAEAGKNIEKSLKAIEMIQVDSVQLRSTAQHSIAEIIDIDVPCVLHVRAHDIELSVDVVGTILLTLFLVRVLGIVDDCLPL